jgi:hypothetical protein
MAIWWGQRKAGSLLAKIENVLKHSKIGMYGRSSLFCYILYPVTLILLFIIVIQPIVSSVMTAG